MGSFQGSLASFSATDLGSFAIKGAHKHIHQHTCTTLRSHAGTAGLQLHDTAWIAAATHATPCHACSWPHYQHGKTRLLVNIIGRQSQLQVHLCCLALLAAALERSGVDPAVVDEVFMGNVCSANVGQVGTADAGQHGACAGPAAAHDYKQLFGRHTRTEQLWCHLACTICVPS